MSVITSLKISFRAAIFLKLGKQVGQIWISNKLQTKFHLSCATTAKKFIHYNLICHLTDFARTSLTGPVEELKKILIHVLYGILLFFSPLLPRPNISVSMKHRNAPFRNFKSLISQPFAHFLGFPDYSKKIWRSRGKLVDHWKHSTMEFLTKSEKKEVFRSIIPPSRRRRIPRSFSTIATFYSY